MDISLSVSVSSRGKLCLSRRKVAKGLLLLEGYKSSYYIAVSAVHSGS